MGLFPHWRWRCTSPAFIRLMALEFFCCGLDGVLSCVWATSYYHTARRIPALKFYKVYTDTFFLYFSMQTLCFSLFPCFLFLKQSHIYSRTPSWFFLLFSFFLFPFSLLELSRLELPEGSSFIFHSTPSSLPVTSGGLPFYFLPTTNLPPPSSLLPHLTHLTANHSPSFHYFPPLQLLPTSLCPLLFLLFFILSFSFYFRLHPSFVFCLFPPFSFFLLFSFPFFFLFFLFMFQMNNIKFT